MLATLNEHFPLPATAGVYADPLNAHGGSLGCGEECIYIEWRQSFTHLV